MLLYFLRHADAVLEGERPLSDKGREQTKKVAKFLQANRIKLDALLISPLLRARETAEPVAKALDVELRVAEALDSGADLADLREALASYPSGSAIMLVGHEPDFSEMISELIGGGEVEMKKAAVALVECSEIAPGAGVLRWLVPVKLMG